MRTNKEIIIHRHIQVIHDRLKEDNLSVDTLRHLNQQMRAYEDELEKIKADQAKEEISPYVDQLG